MFTTNNILEISKITQKKFKQNIKEIAIYSTLNELMDSFKDDMKIKENEKEICIQDSLKETSIKVDERF